MNKLTTRQQEVLDFIRSQHDTQGVPPSLREIANEFGFRSMTAAADHVRALERKGFIEHEPRRARALRVVSPLQDLRGSLIDIPVIGTIRAGLPDEQQQEAVACLTIDSNTLGISPSTPAFALRVVGDSMMGRGILEGDLVVIDQMREPRPGDIVAALIDGENTLKTLVMSKGLPCLRAENPKYPDLIPAETLSIQGVMVGLVRRFQ